jgi:hypothetical protein
MTMDYPYRSPAEHEERLNRQVAGHLHYSLESGATLVNSVLVEVQISFSDETSLIATQDNPLQVTTPGEKDRELDWVLEDQDKIVGFESKYNSPLKASQLTDELAKLRSYADEKNVRLTVITTDTVSPSQLEAFTEDPVDWISWESVAKQVSRMDTDDILAEQRVPLRMLQDLFEAERVVSPPEETQTFNTIRRKINEMQEGSSYTLISGNDEIKQTGMVTGTNPIKFESGGTTYRIELVKEEQKARLRAKSVNRHILVIHFEGG